MAKKSFSISSWLEEHSRWSKLRLIGQSNIVRASLLMPAFGYLLLLNEDIQELLLKTKFDNGWMFGWLLHHLPSTWRIWLLFYGSFLLAAGSILFSYFCPEEIKKYVSAFHMVDAERGHRTGQYQTEQIAEEVRNLYARMSKWESSIFPLPKLRPDLPNMGVGASPELKSGDQWGLALIHVWTLQDIKHPKLRILTSLLFGAGILAVAIPAAITFINVTEVGAKHLFAYLLR